MAGVASPEKSGGPGGHKPFEPEIGFISCSVTTENDYIWLFPLLRSSFKGEAYGQLLLPLSTGQTL